MSQPPPPPPPLSGNLIVGPLLVTNALSWALWGILSTQLLFFLRDIRAERPRSSSSAATTPTTSRRRTSRLLRGPGHGYEEFEKPDPAPGLRFAFWSRARRKKPTDADNNNNLRDTFADAFDDDDINPWRRSFAPPPTPVPPAPLAPVSAFPSSSTHTHARQRSGRSVPSSSDPYSPTAVHPSPLDTDSHSIFPPSNSISVELPSVFVRLLLSALYVSICVRTVLCMVQSWRVVVNLWGTSPSDLGPRWAGIILADIIGPFIFTMTVAYFIYALYFTPQATSKRRSGLRPLSLLKSNANNKTNVNVLPEPYSYPFSTPQSTTQHQRQSPVRSSRRLPWQPAPDIRINQSLLEAALLAILALVVTICGFIHSVRETPLGAPTKLDAVSLIWFAGMLALDLVLCILLCRALGPRLTTGPWMSRVLRVMGEAGGAQLLIALVALVLMVSWRDGKPHSTLPIVAPTILPGVYAVTVFLHVSSSYRHRQYSQQMRLASNLWETSSRVGPSKSGGKFEDIEMGLRSNSRGGGTISPTHVPPTRVDLAAAAAAGAGSSTYSTTNSSADGGAALRAQALAYGREREREREKEREKEERELMAENEAAALGAGVRLHLDRDTHGESSNSASANNNNNNPSSLSLAVPQSSPAAKVPAFRAPSIRSKYSTRSDTLSALSLELPTFRKGKSSRAWRYGYGAYGYGGSAGDPLVMLDDDESGSEEDWDEELDVDSEETGVGGGLGTGTWDYGFAKEERERERERTAAATLLTAGAGTGNVNVNAGAGNEGGTRISVQAGPSTTRRWFPTTSTLPPRGKRSSFPSRPSSWHRSYTQPHPLSQSTTNFDEDNADEAEGNEDDDKLSMLSGSTSRTSHSRRRGGRRSYYASHAIGYGYGYSQGAASNNGNGNGNGNGKGKRTPRLLPRTPGALPLPPPLPSIPNTPGSLASQSSDSLYLTSSAFPQNNNGPSTPAGSVLVIGRASHPPEPSIAEGSIDRAASVAATRASTGSAFSDFSTFSYTHPYPHQYHGHGSGHEHGGYGGYGVYEGRYYPRPVQLPDLDVDVDLPGGDGQVVGEGGESNVTSTGDAGEKEKAEEEARALGSLSPGGETCPSQVDGRTEVCSPHPYSFAATGGGGEANEGELPEQPAARRRWNVHPLKRIADMGRLRF